jgi:DNA repair exonuclease SbcCD ATPase subunit
MKEVIISETANGIVRASVVINKIKEVGKRYELSKTKSQNLLNDLNTTTTSIANTETNFWGNYRKDDLFSLIRESHDSNLKTTKITNELIQNSNANSKDLSEMISALAMLSGLSFEKIAETSSELEEITKQLEQGVDNVGDNSNNIKRVVISQISRVKEERRKQERIDYNFGVLNNNFKELQLEFNEYKVGSEKELKEEKKKQEKKDYNFEVLKNDFNKLQLEFNGYKEDSEKELKEEKNKQEKKDYNSEVLKNDFKKLQLEFNGHKEGSEKELIEEKKKQEKKDYNFEVLTNNFKELQLEINEHKKSSEKKIKEVKKLYQTSSEDHFIKTLKKQKIMIYILFLLFILSVGFQITKQI